MNKAYIHGILFTVFILLFPSFIWCQFGVSYGDATENLPRVLRVGISLDGSNVNKEQQLSAIKSKYNPQAWVRK